MNGHTENKKNTYAHLDLLSTEVLEELLCADIKSPDDDDDEVVLHILEVIEQREKAIPTGRLSDVDKALEEFRTYYNIPEMNGVTLYPEETAESVTDAVTMVGFIPKRPWIRVLGTIAATVIFMFAMLIGAQAAGIDVFGAIGRWTDETFHFVSFPHSIPQDQETTAPNLENVETCNVIKGALKDCEIPEELAPTWYPVGIEASDPKILSDKLSDTVHIFFSDGDKLFFNLNITRYRSTSYLNTHIFEKDDALVEQYVSGSRTFYIMSNLDAITAVWSDGLFCRNDFWKSSNRRGEGDCGFDWRISNMKQLFSSTLVAVMVIACCYGSVSALEAPDMRASLTLSSYNVGLTAGDSAGMISISYDVQSNKLASSIGVETVDIYKADGSYVTSITGSTSNGLIETNSDICKSYYDCQLTSGIFYYANVKVFAKVGSEYDSRVITTSTVKAP